VQAKVQDLLDFFFHLIRPAEDVRIVLGEATHPHQPVEHATAFVAVHGAELGQAHGQIAIAASSRLVHHDVKRAVHRLQEVFLSLNVQRGIHIFAVEIEMSARLP